MCVGVVFVCNWSCEYQFKLDSYNFRILYEIPIVTTKQASTDCTQKDMWRESKYVTTKNQLSTKEGINGGNEKQKSYITYKKQIGKWQKSLSVITFNENRLNSSTKRQRLAEWIKTHIQLCVLYERFT